MYVIEMFCCWVCHDAPFCSVPPDDGWAVGTDRTIIRWDGTEWGVVTNPATEHLYDVHMISAGKGWAVGFDGTIIQWNETIPVSGTFEVPVEVMWSDETPVSDANVVIRDSDGQALNSGVTDANGIFTASLNEGEYTIEVSKGTLSDTKNVTIDSETVIPFTFDASLTLYTLTVNVESYDGSTIDGALVEVNLDGTTVASSETGGNTVFELEEGTYQIVVTWNNQQKEETVELTEDREYSIVIWNNGQNEETIEITEDREDPIPVQKEIPFDLILYITAIVTVSATICILALYIRKRRQRMNPFYELHP